MYAFWEIKQILPMNPEKANEGSDIMMRRVWKCDLMTLTDLKGG